MKQSVNSLKSSLLLHLRAFYDNIHLKSLQEDVMIFHELGNNEQPLIVLIHGCFQPWQSLIPIAKCFENDYRVLIPALNGHTAETKTHFLSIEKEAEEIEEYILNTYGGKTFALCGFSMGGAIAYTILKNNRLRIKNVILDGAPLVASGSLLSKIMENNYVRIAKKSKARDKKTLENFSKNFLPEKYLEDYLAFIDNTNEQSARNMLKSVSEGRFSEDLLLKKTKLLYLYGTKSNEYLSKKSAKLITTHYPEAFVVSFKGDGHCQCAIYESDDWSAMARDFFENR